jgi:uncharacterized cupin superfamily protein
MGTAASIELNLEPINEKWILSGKPVARSKVVARSRDWASSIVVWDCTAGSFRWHYGQDEAIIVMSGEAVLLGENGEERRFAAGDYGFFAAGTVANWRVDSYIRKVALLREPVWRPVGFAMKAWNKVMRNLRLTASSPLGAS